MAAPLALAVSIVVEPRERGINFSKVRDCVRSQRGELLAFECDGGALWVVLVVKIAPDCGGGNGHQISRHGGNVPRGVGAISRQSRLGVVFVHVLTLSFVERFTPVTPSATASDS